ncbi:hypothetical protein, partial [Brevibacillus sp. AF8]|uniref:hypothetical protein n=1 Tax=Brevibacillus sp. AF8 TaxID=2825881 RepID=UPI001E658FB0
SIPQRVALEAGAFSPVSSPPLQHEPRFFTQKEISETSMKREGPLIDIEEERRERRKGDFLDEIGEQ